jgi:uncharacterized membrane protein
MVGLSSPGWRPSRRLLAIALFLSVVANLFLGGLTLGRMMNGADWPWQASYAREFGPFAGRALQHLVRNLDDADKRLVIESLRGHRDELARLGSAVREQREALKSVLRAPQFDRPAAEAALAEMRRRSEAMQAALGAAILEAIEKLPPEARRRLAD